MALVLSAGVVGTLCSLAAFADTSSNAATDVKGPALQEIIVTAQKRSERLQDVPVPVTALAADTLSERDQPRLQDYYQTVPGLSLNQQGNGQQSIAIRGITTGGQTNSTVGITIDDVPFGSSTILAFSSVLVPDIDPSNLQRIEILKGPQGTLYGASSIGGLLKFVTVDPSTSGVSGQVQTDVNTVDHAGGTMGYGVRASVNIPLNDSLALLASGFTRRDPGYVNNVETGARHVNQLDTNGGRLAALWQPSDIVTLKLGVLIQDSHSYGTSAVDVNENLQPTYGDLNQQRLLGTEVYDLSAHLYTANLDFNLGSFDITSITGYGVTSYSQLGDATASYGSLAEAFFNVSGAGLSNGFTTNKLTEELRIASHAGGMFDWLGGVFYTHEENPADQAIPAIDPTTGFPVGLILNSIFSNTFSEGAVFGDVTWHVTDQFSVQVGGRESENHQAYRETDLGTLVPFAYGVASPLVVPVIHSKDNAFTYLVTPQFKISPDLMVYARLASGYRPGGPNPDGVLYHLPAAYGADKTSNYELGAKGDLMDHLFSFDVSLYYINWNNIQIQLVDPTSGFGYFTNASKAKSQGAEFSIESRPIEGLHLAATGSFTDAVLVDALPPSSSAVGEAGDRLPFSARFTSSLSADQDIVMTSAATAFIGGTVSYVGNREGQFAGAPTYVRLDLPSYAQIDLHSGVRFDGWTTSLFVTNVADKRGVVGAGPVGIAALPTSPFYATYIRPRTVGLLLSKKF